MKPAATVDQKMAKTGRRSKGGKPRRVLVAGSHGGIKYLHNGISTAKYHPVTFLPIFLFEQFQRYSNIFFLATALMQQIPNVSPTGRYTTIFPLAFILLCSAVKEIYEDFKRHKEDWAVNRTEAEILSRNATASSGGGGASRVVKRHWKDIAVGDLLLLRQNGYFPADCVLLSSNEPSGICYIETANLDGETNLKARSSLAITDAYCSKVHKKTGVKMVAPKAIFASPLTTALIECDQPNKKLYEFKGKLKLESGEEVPIGPDNVLLRGAKLRNTEWAVGAVVYTGHETKLMMNYSTESAPLKRSAIEKETNGHILALLAILLLICIVSAIFAVRWTSANAARHWYLVGLGEKGFLLYLCTFIILYNNLIPISLQVTLEMVRVIQAHFINSDLELYDEETDTPAQARTSNLNEELGQVRYILSDKTGTLTRNIMDFKKCSIGGRIYDDSKFGLLLEKIAAKEAGTDWEKIREFLVLLAVCHTVIPEPTGKETGPRFTYSASSPDEAALVSGAQKIGFEFVQRTPTEVIIQAMGVTERYEVLTILEFNSDRKRMSAIVRTPAGRIKLYIKGADSIIAKRLSPASVQEFAATEAALTVFATEGLRTLCVASADLTEERYAAWEKKYNDALSLPKTSESEESGKNGGKSRDEIINEVSSEIETNLTLLGATAIEDKLQVGVPETIETLMRAGISIWMLTGDKQETAINIGYSCRLLKSVQAVECYHIINEDSTERTLESIQVAEEKLRAHPADFTLVIDTKSLNFALLPEVQPAFMALSLKCRSVICCRVTPSQKAEVTNAVKQATGQITLGIGDGANDVAMIRAANVGVGISGREGLQAVYSADYAIGQFRFLARLLLVHGSWNLSRVCKLILYSFYKNIVLYVIELWFATVTAFSGQAGFERWSLSLYNLLFTAAPPMMLGLFDRACSAEMLLDNPELYSEQWGAVFNVRLFWFWIGSAIWHSLVLFWLTYFTFRHETLWENGKSDGGGFCFANILFTYVVITVCMKAALETACWNVITHFAVWGSIGAWFLFLLIYARVWPALPFGADMADLDAAIFSTWLFWLALLVIPFVAVLVDIVVKLIMRTCFKSLADKIIELELARESASKLALTNPETMRERARALVLNLISSSHAESGGQLPSPATVTTTTRMALVPGDGEQTVLSPVTDAQIDAAHGYSFSQVEGGGELSQSNVIRMYRTALKKRIPPPLTDGDK